MTSILIDDLNVSGAVLFSDQESYFDEINDDELGVIHGGWTPVSVSVSLSVGFIASYEGSKAAREIHDKNKSLIAWL